MLRLENIPPSEMPEVVHIASELYEKDKQEETETRERQATVDAAAEVGLPEEYLHRAAEQIHVRRIAQARKKRVRRAGLMGAVGAVLILGTSQYLLTRPHVNLPDPPKTVSVVKPIAVPAFGAANWKMAVNPGTQATVAYENGAATLHVQRFTRDTVGHFSANLNTSNGAANLTNFKTVSFSVRGTLPKVRLYLEHGNERWRSPEIAVTARDQLVRIDLSQFERQTRTDQNAAWRSLQHEPPGWVDNLSFKTGWFVNDIGATGDVTLGDINFE